jgi:serine kinase of HPr protein (carbohydrate metabolism regulator)
MKIEEIAKLTKAIILNMPEDLDIDIQYAGASDLMSDVLAYLSEMPLSKELMLITGLSNLQTIRTATLLDIPVVILTRGKVPQQNIIDLAGENSIALLTTELTSYTTCAILSEAGIQGIDKEISTKPKLT